MPRAGVAESMWLLLPSLTVFCTPPARKRRRRQLILSCLQPACFASTALRCSQAILLICTASTVTVDCSAAAVPLLHSFTVPSPSTLPTMALLITGPSCFAAVPRHCRIPFSLLWSLRIAAALDVAADIFLAAANLSLASLHITAGLLFAAVPSLPSGPSLPPPFLLPHHYPVRQSSPSP